MNFPIPIIITVHQYYFCFLQLKAYLQEQSITAHVDDSYAASAINRATFDKTIKRYGNDRNYNSVVFSLVYPVMMPISLLGIVVPLIMLYVCTHKHKFVYTSGRLQRTRFRKLHRQVRAGIISLTIISFAWLLVILAMDMASIRYTEILPNRFPNHTLEIYPDPEDGGDDIFYYYLSMLYYLPHTLFAYDILFSVAYIAIIIVAIVSHFCQDDEQQTEHDDRIYHVLALTVICPILSLLTHLPFIAIAYLNDANHAGSIFIFFTIVTIVQFLILELSFISCFKLLENTSQVSKTNLSCNPSIKCFLVVLVVVVCLFFYFLLAISGCYFYYLPIVQSISRSSNQVIAIYQTILIFIGAFILYKTIFKKTDPLVKALNQKEVGNMISKSATEEWEASNDRDKLISFYSFVIMDVIKNLSKVPTVSRGGVLDTDGRTQMESLLEQTDCW